MAIDNNLPPASNPSCDQGTPTAADSTVLDPFVEDAHWRIACVHEPYFEAGRTYEDYRPAYEMGWSSRVASDVDFEIVELALARQWIDKRGNSSLEWHHAQWAARAAWERADRVYYANDGIQTSEIVQVLNELLVTAHDTEHDYRSWVSAVELSPELKQFFEGRAQQCSTAAGELAKLIRRFHGRPVERGTVSGTVHRGWVLLKGAVGAIDETSVLDECGRCEDIVFAHYQKALQERLPTDIREVIERQAERTGSSREQINELRSRAQARERK